MAKTASTLATNVQTRIRDPNATALATNSPPTTASGNTFTYFLLTQAQYFINAATEAIQSSASLTLAVATTLYPIFSNLASCIKVTSVQAFGGKDLWKADWKTYSQADRKWLIRTGSEPRNWSPIGNDLLAIVPAVDALTLKNTSTVTVQYIKLTNTITLSTDTFDMPDDQLGLVETLGTLFAMLKTKQLGDFKNSMERLQRFIGPIQQWNMNDTNKAV